jgi:DNA invertase Pin-like site-specific DNA recombinase
MDAATIVKMIDSRRGTTSYDDYARAMNIKTAVLYKYIKEGGKRHLTIPNLQRLATFYHSQGDEESP